METVKERIKWLDILKLLGIIAIFCGHFGNDIGRLYSFVYRYHVPLFFFVSGVTAFSLENLSLRQIIGKRFRQILLPYVFFALLSMLVVVLTMREDMRTCLMYVRQFAFGIRNQLIAPALWFFPCLFCMTILFAVLKKLLKRKSLLLLAAILLYLLSVCVFPHNPGIEPSWIFNVDSACYYLIYFVAGYLLEPVLLEKRENRGRWFRIAGVLLGIAAGLYAVCIYMGKDRLGSFLMGRIPFMINIYPVFCAFLLIFFQIILARLLSGVGNLGYAGEQTLWLCGNEFVVRQLFRTFFSYFPIEIKIQNAFAAILASGIMVLIMIICLCPAEKRIYSFVLRKFQDFLK